MKNCKLRIVVAVVVGCFCAFSPSTVEAKKYMRCELSRELLFTHRLNKTFLSNWICLIEHESDRSTTKVTQKPNLTTSYGLFQINSKEWCGKGRKAGLCEKKCEDFIDDNIADDVECAQRIWIRDGFKHWSGWNRFCRNPQNLPNLNLLCHL